MDKFEFELTESDHFSIHIAHFYRFLLTSIFIKLSLLKYKTNKIFFLTFAKSLCLVFILISETFRLWRVKHFPRRIPVSWPPATEWGDTGRGFVFIRQLNTVNYCLFATFWRQIVLIFQWTLFKLFALTLSWKLSYLSASFLALLKFNHQYCINGW